MVGLWLARLGVGPGAWGWFVVATVGGGLSGVLRGRWCAAALGVAALALGAGWYTVRVVERPAGDLARVVGTEPALVTVEGVVEGAVRTTPTQRGALARFARFDGESSRFTLRVRAVEGLDAIDGSPVRGRLWVRVDEALDRVGPGDVVRLSGFVSAIGGAMNPGERDLREVAGERGVSGRLRVERAGLVRVLEEGGRGVWGRVVRWVGARRARMVERLTVGDDGVSSREELLVGALILGERPAEMRELYDRFTATGLAHVLAVSGLHLGVLAWLVAMGVRLTGDRPRVEAAVVIAVTVLLLLIVPVRAPIVRAGVMVVGLVLPGVFGRRYRALTGLALAALVVLLWRPTELFGAGFQLSFGVVGGLVVLSDRFRVRVFGERTPRDERGAVGAVGDWGKDVVAASVCAWAVATPIVAYHIGVFTPWAAALTIVVMPIVAVVLGLGFVAALLVGLGVEAGLVIGATHWCAAVLADVVAWGEGIAWSRVRIGAVSPLLVVGATVVIGWWLGFGSWRRVGGVLATVLLVVWGWVALTRATIGDDVALRWDALAVGDGSCHLLRSGDEALLFDCGGSWYGVGEWVIPRGVRALGPGEVERVVISHPDADHYCGLLDAAARIGVREVLTSEGFVRTAEREAWGPERFVIEALEGEGVGVRALRAGDVFEVGAARVEVLWPPAGARFGRDNDGSLVLRVSVGTEGGARRVVMTGDIERAAMEGLVASGVDLGCDAMEAPHHGSAQAFAVSFVDRVGPGVVVQSTGPRRVGDARWDGVKRGRVWLTTASDGASWVEVMRDGSVRAGSFVGGER